MNDTVDRYVPTTSISSLLPLRACWKSSFVQRLYAPGALGTSPLAVRILFWLKQWTRGGYTHIHVTFEVCRQMSGL